MAIFVPLEPTPAAATRSVVGLTDAELVAEVRRGNDRAFEQLYERYHRRIAAYIYGMVSDYGRAEDLSQDVFMSALRRMRETERAIAFKPWVYEIAKNACIDQFRRTRRSQEVSYDAEEGLGAADYGRFVTTGPTPDVAVDQKMAIDHLRGAFGGLSQTHHEILVMREFEGLSYREIGERLGMSRPSVESTLFRARRRLGEEYEELVSGERCLRVQAIIVAADAAVPGAREQRRLAAHLSHCQRCRRHAKLAGMDTAVLIASRSAPAKIAAVIPLPAFLRRRWLGEEIAPIAANHHVSTLAQLSAQLGASVDPAIASWAKAAAAAATVAIAGMAGGAAVNDVARMDPGGSVAEPPRASSGSRAEILPAKRGTPAVAVPPTPATSLVPAGRAAPLTSGKPQDAVPAAGPPAAPGAGPPAAPGAGPPAAPGAGAALFPGAPQPLFPPILPGAESVIGGMNPGKGPRSGGRLTAAATKLPAAGVTAAAVAAALAAASSSVASKTQLEGAAAAAAAAAAYAAAAEDVAVRAAAVAAAAQATAATAATATAGGSTATKTQIDDAASAAATAAAAQAAAVAAAEAARAAASVLGG
jgi:RNA polymerase sigma factor (sigma-70 family)